MKQKSTVKNDEPKLKKRRKVAVESEEIKASVETERKELAKTKTKRHATKYITLLITGLIPHVTTNVYGHMCL